MAVEVSMNVIGRMANGTPVVDDSDCQFWPPRSKRRGTKEDGAVAVTGVGVTDGGLDMGWWDTAMTATWTLHLATLGDAVHEDYRPTSTEIEWAREQMHGVMARVTVPLPEVQPSRARRSAPVVIDRSADWCP